MNLQDLPPVNKPVTFSSRWGLLLAGLGTAVGTGNIWRFPRIAAQNGGASFLIPWMIFLIIWSLPLLITEFAIGRDTRRGVVGGIVKLIGERFAWMGGFVSVTTVMILFYYSVVTGWTLKYFLSSLIGGFGGATPGDYWAAFTASIWQPILFHTLSALLGGYIIQRGVVKGIERANKILIPALFFILIIAAFRAVTLPGALRGLEFLFNPDLSRLGNYRTWLEAITQSAWSTGAGWGLILTYATYMKKEEDIVLNAATIGFGNNSASLLAGMTVVPTAFAILSAADAEKAMASGNTGLMFIWVPQLFTHVPGGKVFLCLFFLALFSAALSSLISMVELATRILMDAGISRRKAVRGITAAVIVFGLPSAISMEFFENQDWVWGLALMISGLFFALAATQYGFQRFSLNFAGTARTAGLVGHLLKLALKYLIPLEFCGMFAWWLYQSATVYDPPGWWNPLHTYSVGTCIAQWGLAFILLLYFNNRIARSCTHNHAKEDL